MLLAQFHYAACLPQYPRSCIDSYADPVRKRIVEELVIATAEVADNVERTIECLTNVKFRDTLSDPKFYFDGVPGNGVCLEDPDLQGDDPKINGYMAQATYAVLQEVFPEKDWAVHVYNYWEDRTGVVWRCEESDIFGCIWVENVDGAGGRDFHLMYRNKDVGPKDFINSANEDALTGQSTGLYAKGVGGGGIDFGFSCFGDPLNPDDTSEVNNIEVLRREHGYIAFRLGGGIPRGVVSDNIYRRFWEDEDDRTNDRPIKGGFGFSCDDITFDVPYVSLPPNLHF